MAGPVVSFGPAKDTPSLQDKAILIAGANSGMGKQSAVELSKHCPAQLWLGLSRSAKGQAAVEDAKKHGSSKTEVFFLEVYVSYLKSIRTAAKAFFPSAQRLVILVLNLSIMGYPPAISRDGCEL